MKMIIRSQFLVIAAVVGLFQALGNTESQAQSSPNIVIFYADDVGIGDITAYGDIGGTTTLNETPNIDLLANEGMIFTDAHSAAGLCAPSRYSLLTGNLPARGRYFSGQFNASGDFQVRDGQRTIGNILQDQGYNTGYVGKVHLGGGLQDSEGNPYNQGRFKTPETPFPGRLFVDWTRGFQKSVNDIGFDYSFVSHGGIQSSPYIYFENNRAIDELRFAEGRWSWGIAETNRAVVFDQDFVDNQMLGGEIKSVDTGSNSVVGWPYWNSLKTGEVYTQAAKDFIREHAESNSGAPFFLQFESQAVHIPHTPGRDFFGVPVAGVEETSHLDMLREMDLQVGAIVSELRTRNLLDNTIFIFTSDNGGLSTSIQTGHQTSGIYRSRKGSIHEGGHRVPFIVRWSDRNGNFVTPANSLCSEAVSQMDIFSTLADLLDSPEDDSQGLDSTSILPYLFGDFSSVLRRNLIVSAQVSYALRLVRSGVKVIAPVERPTNKESDNGGPTVNLVTPTEIQEIYNLTTDISEENNLIDTVTANQKDKFLKLLIRRISPTLSRPLGRSTRPQDRDRDGLFDYWERLGTGSLSDFDASIFVSNSDLDGDGLTDAEEYFLRSDASTPN